MQVIPFTFPRQAEITDYKYFPVQFAREGIAAPLSLLRASLSLSLAACPVFVYLFSAKLSCCEIIIRIIVVFTRLKRYFHDIWGIYRVYSVCDDFEE